MLAKIFYPVWTWVINDGMNQPILKTYLIVQ